MNNQTEIIIPFLFSLITSFLCTPLCLFFIKKAKLYDDPHQHKHPAILHKIPIPRGGGIPLFLGVWIPAFFIIPHNPLIISLLIASLLTLVIGILDDKYDISPYLRFGSNIGSAAIVIFSGITIHFITNPFGGILPLDTISFSFLNHTFSLFSDIIALFWIVWVMNMLNWSKGVDGQMPGIVAISAITIGILSLRFSNLDENSLLAAQLSFLIAGSALGFLPYNFYPAKIFPGYGATALYFLLAIVSILSGAKLATAILVMGVPMIDGAFTIIRRILSGKSPFWHDKKHLHHLLLKLGFGQRRIALSYWFFSAILGIISLSLSSTGKVFAIVMLLVLVGGTLFFLHILTGSHEKT